MYKRQEFGWLYRGLALLIVACPCALVISTPVSIISALSNAARNGVLIKGGVYLELLSRVKAVAFDKTGTLTQGTPAVVGVRSADCEQDHINIPTVVELEPCLACDELVALADAIERRSEHPLAKAIDLEAQRRGVKDRYPAAEMVQTLTGRGIHGQVAEQQVLIGSHTYFDHEIEHPEAHCQAANADADAGYTTMMVEQDNTYLGSIAVSDIVRTTSQTAIASLKKMGLKAIVMLTGDNEAVAQKIAQQTGVTDVRANLMPADKLKAIKTLQTDYGCLLYTSPSPRDPE